MRAGAAAAPRATSLEPAGAGGPAGAGSACWRLGWAASGSRWGGRGAIGAPRGWRGLARCRAGRLRPRRRGRAARRSRAGDAPSRRGPGGVGAGGLVSARPADGRRAVGAGMGWWPVAWAGAAWWCADRTGGRVGRAGLRCRRRVHRCARVLDSWPRSARRDEGLAPCAGQGRGRKLLGRFDIGAIASCDRRRFCGVQFLDSKPGTHAFYLAGSLRAVKLSGSLRVRVRCVALGRCRGFAFVSGGADGRRQSCNGAVGTSLPRKPGSQGRSATNRRSAGRLSAVGGAVTTLSAGRADRHQTLTGMVVMLSSDCRTAA